MSTLSSVLAKVNIYVIYGLALLLPIFFTPLTSEFYDTAKMLLTGFAVLVLLLVWGLRLITENKIAIVRTPLDLLLILFVVVAVLSTVLSTSPYLSLYGQLPRVYGSLLSQVIIILLYFMVVSNLKSLRQVTTTASLMVVSGLVVSVITLLSYFKLFLPWAPAQSQNFTLTGSPYSAAIFLVILLPIVLFQLFRLSSLKNIASINSIFYTVSLLFFTVTIILVGNLAAWIGVLLALGLALWQNKLGLQLLTLEGGRRKAVFNGSVIALVAVVVVSMIVAILSFTPTIKNLTPLGKLASGYDREIQLPFNISWKISARAFADSPILGTGPASYLNNFTIYKPIEYNATPFWNVRLSSAHDQYLQTWAEMGGAGVLILLILASTFCFYAFRHRDDMGLWASGIIFFIVMAFSPMTILTFTVGIIILALFMSTLRGRGDHELLVDLGGISSNQSRGTHILIPSLIFLPLIVLIIGGFYYMGKLGLGEYNHRVALNAVAANKGLDAYNSLVKAEQINPQIDLYRIDLAQTNFALANAIAAQKGPTQASPSGSLTDQDRTNIQQLLTQAINEGRASVALSPRSAGNWEVLALLYRQVSGVAKDALTFSLDAYGRAIQLDPYNPLLRLAVGGVYYSAKNYDLAIRFFDDAVSLKSDYSNALYNLAIALRDKGNFTEGQTIAETLVAQLQDKPDSQDYKLASALLKELKDKAPSTTQPTTASPSAALQNDNLPKVLDKTLGQPEQVSTPAAVKK